MPTARMKPTGPRGFFKIVASYSVIREAESSIYTRMHRHRRTGLLTRDRASDKWHAVPPHPCVHLYRSSGLSIIKAQTAAPPPTQLSSMIC